MYSRMDLDIGDRVEVKGYGGRVFEIRKIKSLSAYFNGKEVSDVMYTVKDINTGEFITACAEDVSLSHQDIGKKMAEYKKTVDVSLDRYNSLMFLYELFKDDSYKNRAKDLIKLIEEYTEESKSVLNKYKNNMK